MSSRRIGWRCGAPPATSRRSTQQPPDSSAPVNEQIHHDADGELFVPEGMRWMVDFDAAIDVGLGIKISLENRDHYDPNAPIDRLLALGLRLADDPDQARQTLEELL